MALGKHRTALVLGAILFVAAFARFYGLDYHSFRNDELSSWSRSNYESFADVIEYGVRPDPHPPGFQSILWIVDRHVGDSENILRAPSAVAGVLAVVVIFLLGRQLFGRWEGLVAAALMGLSYAPIFYSQDARSNSLLILCAVASSYFLWPLIRDLHKRQPLDRRAAAGFILVSAAACYLHYFGFVLFATQAAYILGLVLLSGRFSQIRGVVLMLLAVALLYAPWWQGFYEDLTVREAPAWIVPPAKDFLLRFLNFALTRSWFLVFVTIGLLLFLLTRELRRLWVNRQRFNLFDEARTADFFVAYWFLAPFILAVVKSWISEPVATSRNLVIVLPALYLLIARGLGRLPVSSVARSVTALLLVTVTVYQLLFSVRYYTTPQKHQYREAVDYVIQHETEWPDTPVVGFAWNKSYLNYYFERLGGQSRVELIAGKAEHVSRVSDMVDNIQPRAFWYVLMATPKADPEFLEYLNDEFDVRDEQEFYGASVRLLAPRSGQSPD